MTRSITGTFQVIERSRILWSAAAFSSCLGVDRRRCAQPSLLRWLQNSDEDIGEVVPLPSSKEMDPRLRRLLGRVMRKIDAFWLDDLSIFSVCLRLLTEDQ
jgi:hypothetical protein